MGDSDLLSTTNIHLQFFTCMKMESPWWNWDSQTAFRNSQLTEAADADSLIKTLTLGSHKPAFLSS